MTVHLVTGHSGEVHVTAAEQGRLNGYLWGEDAYKLSGATITIVDNNTVHISEGTLLINGRHVALNDGGDDVSIESGTVGMYRRDMICLKYEMSTITGVEKCSWVVQKGTPGEDYTTPVVESQSILDDDNPCLIPAYTVDINNLLKLVAVDTLLDDFVTYVTAAVSVREVKDECITELESKVDEIEETAETTKTQAIAAMESSRDQCLQDIANAWDGDGAEF